MKMNRSNLPRGYAKAIFSISDQLNIEAAMLVFLQTLSTITTIPKIKKFLCNINLKDKDKFKLLSNWIIEIVNNIPELNKLYATTKEQQINNRFFSVVNNLIQLLAKKNIFKLIPDILLKYNKLYFENINQLEINITTAILLGDDEKQLILNKLIKYCKKKIAPKFIIDPLILSGIIIRYNDTIIDYSLRKKLINLQKILKSNY